MSIKKIPCGGFYVNDDAVEMIDGKPVLKTSGSDEVLDNAKSTGGIGWTESGEQTVIVDESVITIKGEVVSYATGVFVEHAILEVGSNYTVIFNDSEYVVTGEDFGGAGVSVGAKITADGADFSVYPFTVLYDASGVSPVILVTQSAGTYTVTISESSETVHKIDEKYLPEAAPDPIVENAKQTGGFGYTEQGNQTVITWDGDTEGRESVTVAGTMYKVSDKIITQSDVIGGEYSSSAGITKPITEGRIFDLASVGIENAFGITFEEGTPSIVILCVQNDTVFADTPISAGVYFQYADAYVSSLTYGTPDTIHKIDEKYLPASGEDYFYVTFNYDDDGITLDTSVEEMERAAGAGRVFKAILNTEYDRIEAIHCGAYDGKDLYALFTSGIYSNQMEFFNVHFNSVRSETTMDSYTVDVTPS